MAGSGGSLQPTSTFRNTTLELDTDYSQSEVLDAVVKAGEGLGYDFETGEFEEGFLASYGRGTRSTLGTEGESLRIRYDKSSNELQIHGALRTGLTGLVTMVERELG